MHPPSLQMMHEAAQVHLKAHRTAQAVEVLQRIVQAYPRDPRAPFMLGVIAYQADQLESAIQWLGKSVVLYPDLPDSYFLLGMIHHRLHRLPEAIDAYQKFLARKPGDGKALNNLGRAVLDSGDAGQAIAILNQAIKAHPPNAGAFNNLGDAISRQGNLNGAMERYHQAIAIDPNCAEAHGNLGVALSRAGQLTQGVTSIRRAIQIKPDSYNPRFNLAKILRESGRLDEAVEQLRIALQLRPASAEAHNLLGNIFGITGQISQCITAQRRAVELKPDFAAAHSNLLLSLHYLPDIAPADLFAAHQQWAIQQTGRVVAWQGHAKHRAGERVRVGYVSPNFNMHSVAWFFEPVLAAHDRSVVEIFCYSDVETTDQTTGQLQELSEHWREISGMKDAQLAAMIQQDRIDILVDLAGHTAQNRLTLFAMKPAATQISWLGYPDTTGLATIDYRLTDAISDPPGISDSLHSEKLIRIPGGAWAYAAVDPPEIGALPALVNGYVTFGSFNNLPKITHKTLESWSRILDRVQGSRLILKSAGLTSSMGRNYVMQHLTCCGIATDRVELIGWLPTTRSHLQLYNRVDIALDTFPYNGTTTTCEALWMGVPVITFTGSTHVSRVGAALLTNADCPQYIAADVNGYEHLAVDLASRQTEMVNARATLRQRIKSSPLCNARRLAKELESFYMTIHRAGLSSGKCD